MIKNIMSLVLLALLLLGASACSNRSDELFERTADERLELSLGATRSILTSAPNGWQMSIFPSSDARWGGYTVWLRFHPGQLVEATNEFVPDAQTTRSEYRLDGSNGPSLVFDTYNPALHMFSQPNVQDLVQTYPKLSRFSSAEISQGLGGDYSYRILSATAEQVVLQGARSEAIAVLHPAGASAWSEQLSAIQATERDFGFTNVKLSGVGEDYSGTFTLESRQIDLSRGDERLRLPFRFTEQGIELYEPQTFGGKKVQSFVGDASGQIPVLRAVEAGISLSPKIVPPAELLTSGENLWLMYDMNATPKYSLTGRAYYGVNTFESIWQGTAHIFNLMIGLPKYGNEGFGLYSTVVNTEEGVQYMRIPLDYTIESDTEITLRYKPEDASPTGQSILQKSLVQMVVAGLSNIGTVSDPEDDSVIYWMDADVSARRFTLSVDNAFAPTKLILKDKDMPSNTITLTRIVVR